MSFYKARSRIILTVILIVFVLITIILLIAKIFFPFKVVNSPNNFINGDYMLYNGGNTAKHFFQQYVDLSEYNKINFNYIDGERIIFTGDRYTIFALDIAYNEYKYQIIKEDILADTDKPSQDDRVNYKGDFLITTIVLDSAIYENNYCGIFFNDEYSIIRYIFVYDIARNEAKKDLSFLLDWNISLEWYINSSE